MKKGLGTLLVIVGLLLGGWGLVEQTEDNKILKVGSLEIKEDRTKNINWMIIGGAVSLILGIAIISVGGKR